MVDHKFNDGFELISAHHTDAGSELKAFCVLNCISFEVLKGDTSVHRALAIKVLLKSCAGTRSSKAAREAVASRFIAKKIKFHYKEYILSEWDLNRIKAAVTTKAKILREHKLMSLAVSQFYLRNRPSGWRLLGVKSKTALAKMLRVSFGKEGVKEMRLKHRLPYHMVQLMLARKNQVEFDRLKAKKLQKKERQLTLKQ